MIENDRSTSQLASRQELKFVLPAIVDMNGIFRGKRTPATKLERLQAEGLRMPMSSIGVDIWGVDTMGTGLTFDQGDLDGLCVPTGRAPLDLGFSGNSDLLLPLWMKKEDGSPYFADCRHLLSSVLERFAARKLTPVVATEVEFYLLEAGSPHMVPAAGSPHAQPAEFDNIYSIAEMDSFTPFLDEVCRMAECAGIAVEGAISEGGPRQFEFNLVHKADALRIADDTIYFKQIIRNAARRHGCQASFMAKPYQDRAGSGLHLHFSVIDATGRNVFDNGAAEGSSTLLHAVAGLLTAMPDMTLAFAPHLNSYRRLAPGGLAPTVAAWGYENRTAALRIPAGANAARRIEHRVAGADANPYLVLASVLSSALDGMEREIEPPVPTRGNAHDADAQTLARDWREALDRFSASALTNQLLHPECVAAFSACKRQEQETFAAQVSAFELATYRTSV